MQKNFSLKFDFKKKIILVLSWVCVLISMSVIFNLSGENGEVSSSTSQSVVENILGIFMDKEDITPDVVIKYQIPIRKTAHFGIYMVLGFSLACAYRMTFKNKKILPYVISLPTASVYAVSDELHQKFTYGRVPSLNDVFIDSCGAFTGILVYFIFISLFLYFQNKENVRHT